MLVKKLFILACILLSSVISYAQTSQPQIEGFWGVKLGESETTVVRTVRQSYPSADYDKSTTGKPFRVNNVKLAGLDIDKCEFKFKNGIFTEAKFNKVAGWRSVNMSQVQNYLSSLAQTAQSDYQDICDRLSEKYGTPKVSGQTVSWRTSNGNSITVKPWSMADNGYVDDYGRTWAGMGIHIIYSKGEHLNDF